MNLISFINRQVESALKVQRLTKSAKSSIHNKKQIQQLYDS